MCSGGLWGQVTDSIYFLCGAALKFSSTPPPLFTEAATGACEKLERQSQEPELGETQCSSRVRLH